MGFAEKAHALADKMRERHEAGKPLFKEKHRKADSGMSSLSLSFHKSVKKAFKLLGESGYSTFINDKTKEGEDLLNGFNALIRASEENPAATRAAFADMDKKTLSQFFYMVNKHALRDGRTLVPVLKGRCLEAVLERAAELGPSKP